MTRATIIRIALAYLGVSALLVGVPATVAPHSFYADFPFITQWVELLPPYNEHLVTDVGGLYLGFAVLFFWGAWTLEPTLARAVSVAWLLVALLHLLFHATHLGNFGTADAIAEIASLATLVVPPLAVLWALRSPV